MYLSKQKITNGLVLLVSAILIVFGIIHRTEEIYKNGKPQSALEAYVIR